MICYSLVYINIALTYIPLYPFQKNEKRLKIRSEFFSVGAKNW